jgi:uncharacterized DUF497 family protein
LSRPIIADTGGFSAPLRVLDRIAGLLVGLANNTEYQYMRTRARPWTSSWDTAKEQADRRKHGIDFRSAAKVFLDTYVIESNNGELRFNAIGLVDGRMLLVTYTLRGEVVRIISARGAEPHEKRKYHEL